MRKVRLNLKALHKSVAERHRRITVGEKYFLSNFYDKEGCIVRVLEKSTRLNRAGFRSTVTVEILERDLPKHLESFYEPGSVHTVNAANLYEHRMYANPKFKLKGA